MSLDIPINIPELETEIQSVPTKTPYFDPNTGKFAGYCDGLVAMAQAVKFALLTPRFRFIVLDNQYGSELSDLIDSDYDELVFQSEAKRRIKDALLCDERITDVYDFDFSDYKDDKIVRFSVGTIYGALHEQEVTINV
ncbi:DUF2634 domain-containing protein [Anaerovorax sp. IOR16]|uniref:DUF2634 domain-containing protein n=1 Tax=Anaerovorax sp. IOR16 TaxID=2773458 RepID=UPI0019D18563|nr:DUF2634 domain-containing protein [Anaerovorax sp. IOR16]